MIAKSLRGIAAAFLIGTASIAVAGLSGVGVAEAAGVRPEVGKPLQEAIGLAKEGKGSAALAKVREAESAKDLTSTERELISKTKEYVQTATGDFSGGVSNATTAKAKFAADYNKRRYHEVVSTDAELLRKYGVLDAHSKLIVAQAYYLSGDYRGALRYLSDMGDGDQVLKLRMAAATKLGDSRAQDRVAESLVLKGQTKYWNYLFASADNTKSLKDPQTLGIFRVRFLTGNMRNAEDYSTATQLTMLLGFPQEGVSIEQQGFDKKVLSDARQQRLLSKVKEQAAQQQKDMASIVKKAHAAKNGDALVNLGEIYWGIGKYQDAVDAVQAGLAKGVTDQNHAEIVLGMAYSGLKNSSQAVRALNKVRNNPAQQAVAKLWSVYARTR